ncbi:hypothetical protein AB0N07_45820 [Streptomyces sp. NPDC051172]|uniref:hypothetical protein n=1 Tax=Streptomyces sp. NPDC051172 TaxID=3155796 RepID=UPI00341521F2
MARQPDGYGKRIGEVAEITALLCADKLFVAKGVVLDLGGVLPEPLRPARLGIDVTFINNDTQVIGAVTYDGDFKPYMADIFANAAPWFDEMFEGVAEGYPGAIRTSSTGWRRRSWRPTCGRPPIRP